MGDLLKKYPIFAKLGFDETNQWLLYHEPLQKFFQWIAENITDENVLSDEDILEMNHLKSIGQWYEGEELERRVKELEEKHPGILTCTEEDIQNIEAEYEHLGEIENDYIELTAKMKETLNRLNHEKSDIDMAIHAEEERAEKAYATAMELAKEIQEVQKEKANAINELESCYSEPQNPPLFMHEMPLEEAYSTIESYVQHVTMYLNNNLKIKSTSDSMDEDEEKNRAVEKLEALERQIYAAELQLEKKKMEAAGYQRMIDDMDVSKIEAMSPSELKREIFEMVRADKKQYSITYDTLLNDLEKQIKRSAESRIEEILYENTKRKYERAAERLEKLKSIDESTSQMLNYSEILWIVMQFDYEKIKKYYDYLMTPSPNENDAVMRRIEGMQQLKNNRCLDSYCDQLDDMLAKKIAKILNIPKPESLEASAYEYEKIKRQADNILAGIIEKKFYESELKTIEELKSIEKRYTEFIYDGPINRPMFITVEYIKPIYEVRATNKEIEKTIRKLRCDIQMNITDKMNSDRFYRYLQLLWIWFLTEPKKVVHAIEEVKKAAAKPSNFKTLSGLRRQEN